MVRSLAIAAVASALLATPSVGLAQTVPPASAADWSRAGGGLFPGSRDADGLAYDTVRAAAVQRPGQGTFDEAIAAAALRHGVDARLLAALVAVESGFRPGVCSPAGACGLTQLMPGTARDLGVADRFEPAANLNGGAAYLAQQLRRFGDVRLALAAYNSGPERVARLGRIPDIAETRDYVARVVDCYLALAAGRAVRGSRDCRAGGRP